MLLRWLLIALFALGTLVARTRGVCDQQCEAAGGSPRGGRPQRSRSRSPSPRRGGARQQPPRPLGSDPRLTMLAGVIASMITAAATLRWTPALARAQTLGGLASMCSMNALLLLMLVLVPGLAPAFYQRHAAWLLAATRLCFFALPVLRDPLDVQHVFQSQPSARLFGIIPDLFTLSLGLRGVALLLAPLVCPLPMLPNLALSAFAVQRMRTTAYMFSSPMLQHSIWRRRIAWVHRIMGALPLLAPEPAALRAALASGPEPQHEVECRVFLSLCQMALGTVVPILLLAKLQVPFAAAAAGAPAVEGADSPRGRPRRPAGGRRGGSQRHGSGSGSPLKHLGGRCLRWLQAAEAETDAAMQHLCHLLTNRFASPLLTTLAWWALASLMWVGALLLEQPRLALAPSL